MIRSSKAEYAIPDLPCAAIKRIDAVLSEGWGH